jgi:uncharacterized protein
MERASERRATGPAPWHFLVGTLLWTWLLTGGVALSGRPWLSFPSVLVVLLGGLGPAIVALSLVAARRWDARLDATPVAFLRRALDPRTVPWRWYLGIIALVGVLHLLPLLFDPSAVATSGVWTSGPVAFLLVGFFGGALEEIGWRGYGQEALQRRMPVLLAALVIGLFWAAWHLPLFFIAGTYQAGLGVGTAAFWGFHGAIVFGSVLYGWLYNASGGATFAALMFHGLGNVMAERTVDAAPATEVAVTAGLALLVTLGWWRLMANARRPGPEVR